ncbi:SPOR domain-containing protein [Vibrio nitrifigilis]|nr:SPOR domain-containing protein [Vibrio nitrifigilis]
MERHHKVTQALLLSLIVIAAPLYSSLVSAQSFLCDAKQTSSNALPVLDKSCPIGDGLWGDRTPKHKGSQFWIQCGMMRDHLSLEKAKPLYRKITTDVWLKPENNGVRCLIGPYEDYKKAKADMLRVRTLPNYKKVFIREVSQKGKTMKAPAMVKKAPQTMTKMMAVEKKVPAKRVPVTAPVTKPIEPQNKIQIRRQAQVGKLNFAVPYINDDKIQFYMDQDLPWNRLDYDHAEKTCSRINMRLATELEWRDLLQSGVMQKERWPINLPYWGWNHRGLFMNGKTNNLKGTSLLNVLCVTSK